MANDRVGREGHQQQGEVRAQRTVRRGLPNERNDQIRCGRSGTA